MHARRIHKTTMYNKSSENWRARSRPAWWLYTRTHTQTVRARTGRKTHVVHAQIVPLSFAIKSRLPHCSIHISIHNRNAARHMYYYYFVYMREKHMCVEFAVLVFLCIYRRQRCGVGHICGVVRQRRLRRDGFVWPAATVRDKWQTTS